MRYDTLKLAPRIALAVGISLAIVIVLQFPTFSIHGILTGERIFSATGLATLEFIAGFINSTIVCAACFLVVRHPLIGLVIAAVVVQLLWLEVFQRTFSDVQTIGDAAFRFATHVGIISAGILLLFLLRKRKTPR